MREYWRRYWQERPARAGEAPAHRVGRTLSQEPMSPEMLELTAGHTRSLLGLEAGHSLLDLCCGNGLVTVEVAPACRWVVGVDFSPDLVAELRQRAPGNVAAVVGDATTVAFRPGSFDRVLCGAALQHFDLAETARLFASVHGWLRPGGRLVITDVPDLTRRWHFFDTPERQDRYFAQLAAGAPIIGTWFEPAWLEKLARHAGFTSADALPEPPGYWYAHYRFDFVAAKAT